MVRSAVPMTFMVGMGQRKRVQDKCPPNSCSVYFLLVFRECPILWQETASTVLSALMDSEFGFVFSDPVDPIRLNLPDYHEASPLSYPGCTMSGSSGGVLVF